MKSILNTLKPYAKAIVAGIAGAILPLVSVGTIAAWNWKAIVAAAIGAVVSTTFTFLTPNTKPTARRR